MAISGPRLFAPFINGKLLGMHDVRRAFGISFKCRSTSACPHLRNPKTMGARSGQQETKRSAVVPNSPPSFHHLPHHSHVTAPLAPAASQPAMEAQASKEAWE
jgi:hypothetical protein